MAIFSAEQDAADIAAEKGENKARNFFIASLILLAIAGIAAYIYFSAGPAEDKLQEPHTSVRGSLYI